MNIIKKNQLTILLALVAIFCYQQISLWGSFVSAASDSAASTSTVDQSAVDDTQSSISDVQKQLDKAKKAQAKLQQNLSQINQAVSSTQSEINKTKSTITQATDSISRKQMEIDNLNQQINLQTELLKSFMQQMYYTQGQPILNVVLTSADFSQAFSSNDHLSTLEDKVVDLSHSIAENKSQIEQDKSQLADMKQQHEQILSDKMDQKQSLLSDQADTQQSIADKQKTIDRLNKELAQLQSDLNTLLGKSYNAKDIKDAVSFASDQTGVPMGFLIGVLKMETNLGANVGGCTYSDVESGAQSSYKSGKLSKAAWNTFQNRRDIFKDICDSLDYDYEKQKVSCNPKGYVGTGGAMGVAQFMPDTWQGYSSQVASITGHKNPDPWNLTDGVVAMASKLKRTPGVTDGKKSALKSAACSYLGTCYAPYVDGILYWADNYKDLLN